MRAGYHKNSVDAKLLENKNTMSTRSLDPFFIVMVTYYIKWVKTPWTYSMLPLKQFSFLYHNLDSIIRIDIGGYNHVHNMFMFRHK